jgi:hypothetical protein
MKIKTKKLSKSAKPKLRVKNISSKASPSGGAVNKAKTADKMFNAMDGYIRG